MMYVSVAWSSWLVRPSTSSVGARSSGARAAGTHAAAHVDESRPLITTGTVYIYPPVHARGNVHVALHCPLVHVSHVVLQWSYKKAH